MLSRLELSQRERYRRYYYELARDQLEAYLVDYMLLRSYATFKKAETPYPFLEMRELKPGGFSPHFENPLHNRLLLLFYEGSLKDRLKKHLRYREKNALILKNLREFHVELPRAPLSEAKILSAPPFGNLLESLLPLDYAILIQQDVLAGERLRFAISHFHVKIDVLLDEMVEQLAKRLKYITRDLYERGETYAQLLEHKFFEYYSFHETVAGRRSAAMIAHQLLRQREEGSTVFVGSTEGRSLTSLAEETISKQLLLSLTRQELRVLLKRKNLRPDYFTEHYVVDADEKSCVVIFKCVYEHTEQARPPRDGKLRGDLNPKARWVTITKQFIVPKPGHHDQRPIPYPTIYRAAAPKDDRPAQPKAVEASPAPAS